MEEEKYINLRKMFFCKKCGGEKGFWHEFRCGNKKKRVDEI